MINLVLILLFASSNCCYGVTKRSADTDTDYDCGVPHNFTGFVYNDGTTATRLEFPWKIALYKKKDGKWDYNCGGTLVSNSHVVTAAHCIQNKNERSPALPRDLRVILGAHDFSDQHEEGRISSGVKKYKLHDDWNPSNAEFGGDIAVLELTNRVLFNEYIRPVCLPEVKVIDVKTGSLAGWGLYDNSQKVSDVPRKVELSIISDGQCFREDPRLVTISTDEMFCAGKKGVAVCPGDSRSGLYVVKDKKFYLRGLVSSSAVDQCTDGYLALYSDVLKYLDFVTALIGSSSDRAILNCVDHGYAYCCVLKNFIIKSANTRINSFRTIHEAAKSNADVKFLHFWVENTDYLANFRDGLMAQTFPNLIAYVIEGYDRGNTKNKNNNINLKNSLKRENFKGLESVKRVGINYCKVEKLPEDLFYDMKNLENVNLHHNNIRQLPARLLINTPKLNVFSAQNNAIEVIPADFFEKNPGLWFVQLDNNKIAKIGVNFKNFNNLHVVSLSGNVCVNTNFEIKKSGKDVLNDIETNCSK